MPHSLESILLENPDNAEAWLVYADYLQQQGDVRGELIALEHQGAYKQAKAILEQNKALWLKNTDGTPAGRSFLENWLLQSSEAILGWKYGFLQSISLQPLASYRSDAQEPLPVVEQALKLLLGSRSALFLREIYLRIDSDYIPQSFSKSLPCCNRLWILPGSELADPSVIGPLDHLPMLLPALRELRLAGWGRLLRLGDSSWSSLKELSLEIADPEQALADNLANTPFPQLQRLKLVLDYWELGTDIISPVIGRTSWPLRHLHIEGTDLGDTLVQILLDSPLLPQLETLSLPANELPEAAILRLIHHADRLKHLKNLDISNNNLPPSLERQLMDALA
jgi:uncharacterized protein (TIGR02996 family)